MYSLLITLWFTTFCFAQDSEKIKATLLLKVTHFQNEMFILTNSEKFNSERTLILKNFDNLFANNAFINYTFQKEERILVKETFKKKHFLDNANAKYYKVHPLLIGDGSFLTSKSISSSKTSYTVSIWHLADYYFSAETSYTYLTRYDLQMAVYQLTDDFNETAFNIEIERIDLYKKEVKLDLERRNSLQNNKIVYANISNNFPLTSSNIDINLPYLKQVKDSTDAYVNATQNNVLQIKGKIIGTASSLQINEKAITLESDSSFAYTLPLEMKVDTEKKIIFQIIENQYIIQKELYVQRTSDGEIRDFVKGTIISPPTSINGNPAKYYALFIGVQDYQDKDISNLNYPIIDAEKLKNVLVEHYTFQEENVTFLKNPTRSEIIGALDALTTQINSQSNNEKRPNTNLLIFYAGHGHLDSDLDKGYWFAKDAQKWSSRANWFSNSDLRDYIGGIKTQHTLVIVDACFAGSLLVKDRGLGMPLDIYNIYRLKSRKAMTSGALTSVPDKSAFAENLVKSLENFAKERKTKYVEAGKLFYSFKEKVQKSANTTIFQVPVYGAIQGVGDELGEFIFIKK